MKRKSLVRGSLVLCTAFVLAACGGNEEESKSKEEMDAQMDHSSQVKYQKDWLMRKTLHILLVVKR